MISALLLPVACSDEGEKRREPETPEDMYARAQELLYPRVDGEESNWAGALQWTRRAAEAGLVQARTDLGALYLYGGKGVARDVKEAFRWFSRAVEQGSQEARVFLGIMYYEGMGIGKDVKQAMEIWRPAAEAGIAEAQYRLGHVLAQADETAAEGVSYLQRAAMAGAQKGIAAAACDLGNIYARGQHGIPADMQKAAKWYGMAADAGNPQGQYVYALMFLEGHPMAQDSQQGLTYLRLAAGQDYLPAMVQLVRYLRQTGGEEQDAEADAWMKRVEELRKVQESMIPPAS